MGTIERTVYDAITQDANSTIRRVPGTVGIKSGTISIFFPDVRKGRVKYVITDTNSKRTDVAVDAPLVTPEGITITLLPEGITPGRQFATVETTGSVGLLQVSVVLNDWDTPDIRLEAVEEAVADHESRIKALESA